MELQYLDFPAEIKASEAGIIEGWGAIFSTPDSYRDVIEPGAFRKTLAMGGHNRTGIPMLYSHDPHRVIGKWIELTEKKKGLWVKGQLTLGVQDADDIYLLVKSGALRGLSIGFNSEDDEYDKVAKVKRVKEIDLYEISPVAFPAHRDAQIENVKAIAPKVKAALDRWKKFTGPPEPRWYGSKFNEPVFEPDGYDPNRFRMGQVVEATEAEKENELRRKRERAAADQHGPRWEGQAGAYRTGKS